MHLSLLRRKGSANKINARNDSQNMESSTATDRSLLEGDSPFYEDEYKKAIELLDSLRKATMNAKEREDSVKEATARVAVLVQDWKKQLEETRKQCPFQIFYEKLAPFLDYESVKIKSKVIKCALIIFKQLNLSQILMTLEDSKPLSKEEVKLKARTLENMNFILKESFKISKDPNNDKILAADGIVRTLLEFLDLYRKIVSPNEQDEGFLDLIHLTFGVLKNAAANEEMRKRIMDPRVLENVAGFMHFFKLDDLDEKNEQGGQTRRNMKVIVLYTQITGLLRNLAIDPECTQRFVSAKIIQQLSKSIELHSDQYELILNTLRLLSKISLSKECCSVIYKNQTCLLNMLGFFKTYKQNIYIIIRISFILANMTSFYEDIREQIYFFTTTFKEIYSCFDYYYNKDINPQKNDIIDKFGLSYTAWDFKIIQKESDQDALIKLIRLIANLLTMDKIGIDFITNKGIYFKDALKKNKQLLATKNVTVHSELIVCSLTLVSNITFYEKIGLSNDFDLKKTKQELISLFAGFAIQTENEEITLETLRALSNFSRHKDLIKTILKQKIVDALVILLNHSSKDIVFYVLGVLINVLSDEEIKKTYGIDVVKGVYQVLKDCTMDDYDLILNCLKCLGNGFDLKKNSLDSSLIKNIEDILVKFGQDCDIIINHEQQQKNEAKEFQDIRFIINQILNGIPEELFGCPISTCGRKFKDKDELKKHLERRHANKAAF